ncbi:MAG: putative porin [Verrucomicrobiaceae bacterium]
MKPHRSLLLLLLAAALPAQAQEPVAPPPALPQAALPTDAAATADGPPENPLFAPPGATPPPAPASPSTHNVTVNLLNLMVKKGLITGEEAQELIVQAETEAEASRAQPAAAAVPQPNPDDVRVTYVPEIVKNQLRDDIKRELAADKEWLDKKLYGPGTFPDWISRWEPFGDLRVRYETQTYPLGNDKTGAFPNFNAINTGSPFDIAGTEFSPQYNVDQERQRTRFRLRLGADINLESGWTAGIRLGTGDTNSPVSGNQTFGLASQGQGGNFSKYAVWIDRAFLKYEVSGEPDSNLALQVGRFDNPFMSTTLIFSEDLGFDGFAFKGRHEIADGFVPFLTGGIFPIFNTDLNFSSNAPAKFESTDKWLYAGQVGVDWKVTDDVQLKAAVAYYHFDGVEGRLSTPFIPLTEKDAGDTDNTRPSFAQKGNTYRAIRDIIPSVLNDFGTSRQYQYFGLATPFEELAYDFQLDLNHFEPYQISVVGQYITNLAFNAEEIDTFAVNNRGPTDLITGLRPFEGDNVAWNLALRIGKAKFEKAWDWQANVGYRYVGSDSVVDGFNDQDFGGGGTNVEGFTIGAGVALSPRVRLGFRWMSADEIAGPPLKADIFQFDIHAKF